MGLDNPLHIVLLVVILLLVFGARRIPEIGRSLGTGMREFKQSVTGDHEHQAQAPLPAATPQAPPQPVQAAAPQQTTPEPQAVAAPQAPQQGPPEQ